MQGSFVTRAARILIVDDDPLLQKSLTLLLMMQGYDVESATTAQAAFEALDRHRPELIVLDLGLPDLDGLEVCTRVRQASDVPTSCCRQKPASRTKCRRSNWAPMIT